MGPTTINARVKNLYKTEAEWLISNPVLLAGEIAIVQVGATHKFKIGDGIKTFALAEYAVFETGNLKGALTPASSSFDATVPISFIAETGNYPNYGGVEITGAAGYIVWDGEEWRAVNVNIDLASYTTLDLLLQTTVLAKKFYRNTINFANVFPYHGVIALDLIDGSPDQFYREGVLKELYIVFIRGNSDGSTGNIIQIGEKIGGSVGVNLNILASGDGETTPATLVKSYVLTGAGLKFRITIDWDIVSKDETYSYTTEIPLNTIYFVSQAELVISKPFLRNTVDYSLFPFSGILDISLINGKFSEFFTALGAFRDLYIVFIRGNRDGVTTNIIQIGEKVGSSVGVNLNVFAQGDDATTVFADDRKTIILRGIGNTTKFAVNIDFDIVPDFSGTTEIPLNTQYFANKAVTSGDLNGKTIVCFGDSVTEFGNYPDLITKITGAKTYKIGFGGCRMAEHSNADYNELSMYKVAQTVSTQNFTAMDAAVANLIISESDDNSSTVALLKTIDFDQVDIVTIFYGTNDFSSNDNVVGTNNLDPETTKGAANLTVKTLLEAYPHLRIAFITPTHRYFNDDVDDSDLAPNTLGVYLKEYCDGIEDAANHNHLPCLNMYRSGGFDKYNHTLYFVDGVHPNSLGYSYLAEKISAFLKSLFIY